MSVLTRSEPVDELDALIEEARQRARRRRRRAGATILALAALGAGLLAGIGAGVPAGPAGRARPAPRPEAAGPVLARSTPFPAAGFAGRLTILALATPAPSQELVFFSQCIGCDDGIGLHGRLLGWVARSGDGGRSWKLYRTPPLGSVGVGASGDAWGTDDTRGAAGAGPRAGAFAAHDGSLVWRAASARTPYQLSDVTVAGGQVWATAYACREQSQSCHLGESVLEGTSGGRSLRPVPVQPFGSGRYPGYYKLGAVVAVDGRTAYVSGAGTSSVVTVATRDGGRHWTTLPTPCPAGMGQLSLAAAGPRALWVPCTGGTAGGAIARSLDAGRHWILTREEDGIEVVEPASAAVAWGLDRADRVVETTDGGARWRVTLRLGPVRRAPSAAIAAAGANSAVVAVTRRRAGSTRLEVDATADGGRSWRITKL
jgi:hypothetical protein